VASTTTVRPAKRMLIPICHAGPETGHQQGVPPVRTFSTGSRPALRAAAFGGRPRPAVPFCRHITDLGGHLSIPSEWQPLSQRYGEPPDEELYEGIPTHLMGPLVTWVSDNAYEQMAETIALRLRIDLRTHEFGTQSLGALIGKTSPYPDLFLDVIDLILLLDHEENPFHPRAAEALERILSLGGSLWRVAADQRSLEQRVDETTRDAATTLIDQQTTASSHLASAWHYCYGRNPNPSRAYSESIKAVEAAAVPVISPRNPRATLGTVLRDLGVSQTHWQLAIRGPDGTGDITPLLTMIRLLWQGQSDRHGGITPTAAPTQSAAEMAVHLGMTLTQWFQSGGVERID